MSRKNPATQHPPDTASLFESAQSGNVRAADQLIRDNIGLVQFMAGQFSSLPYDMAYSTALDGLHRAIMRYRPGRGRFGPFASTVIRHALLTAVRGEQKYHQCLSLDGPHPDNGDVTLGDMVAADCAGPDSEYDNRDSTVNVLAAMKDLPVRERAAVSAYFWRGLTYRDIAARLRVSSETARLVVQRAIEQMRSAVA